MSRLSRVRLRRDWWETFQHTYTAPVRSVVLLLGDSRTK